MRLFSHRNRSVDLSHFPLERLPRLGADELVLRELRPLEPLAIEDPTRPASIANAVRAYIDTMDQQREGMVAATEAPIPADPHTRAKHLKAACYYLDASMAGVCALPASAHLAIPIVNQALGKVEDEIEIVVNPMATPAVQAGRQAWQHAQAKMHEPLTDHAHALVIICEYPREPRRGEPGWEWLDGAQAARAAARVAEVGAVMVNYLRMLGFASRLHTGTYSDLDLRTLIVAAGLGVYTDDDQVAIPYLGTRYGVAAISTAMALAADAPLARDAPQRARDFKWWVGIGGTRPGFEGERFANRDYHLGVYPMEKVKRVAAPTTIIDAPEVPRVPKRHDHFIRAALGDLGTKAQNELAGFRMISKSPFGHAMQPPLGAMVPLQYDRGELPDIAPGYEDPEENTKRIKAALYFLGADMVGVCEIPDYAWYSHDIDGSEIEPYHRYAIAILVDQGYETMEGASGDDWISGAQSMRAYMRAQLIGGIVGAQLRRLGFSARGHSVMDQDVNHIPIILQAGLGELSRIGELVLNPYVGPRFKSGMLTTSMPLTPDQPIDFGLQDFCEQCQKCARECPCSAISFGDKIMFNGYEMWKPDVEKCARYRITNPAGSMCGRCMKTCPFNLEGYLAERPFLWAAMHLPFSRKWLADLDDKIGNGKINATKKWWWDLDADDGGAVVSAKKTNERELVFRPPLDPAQQKLACYPPELSPPPLVPDGIFQPQRKAGMEAYKNAPKPSARGSR